MLSCLPWLFGVWGRMWHFIVHMSHDMTKPTKWVCAEQRLWSAWVSAQSDKSSFWTQWVSKDPSFLHADSKDSDQTRRMPSWSRVFAGAQPFCWFCHVALISVTDHCLFMYFAHEKAVVVFYQSSSLLLDNTAELKLKIRCVYCKIWLNLFPRHFPKKIHKTKQKW